MVTKVQDGFENERIWFETPCWIRLLKNIRIVDWRGYGLETPVKFMVIKARTYGYVSVFVWDPCLNSWLLKLSFNNFRELGRLRFRLNSWLLKPCGFTVLLKTSVKFMVIKHSCRNASNSRYLRLRLNSWLLKQQVFRMSLWPVWEPC